MFKTAATKIAHNSTLPSLGGNKDLRPLQDLITAEKAVLISFQKLNIDFAKASEALKIWGQGEGEDLKDTLSASTAVMSHFSEGLSQCASHEHTVRDHMKSIRSREEALDELKRRRKNVVAKADSSEKKLNKMSPDHKNIAQQTESLNLLREQIRQMDTEIMVEEAGLGDFKRKSARDLMSIKFGSLMQLSEKGIIVSGVGKQIAAEIPQEPTEPGLPRHSYNGHARTDFLAAEAQHNVSQVTFNGVSEGASADGAAPPSRPFGHHAQQSTEQLYSPTGSGFAGPTAGRLSPVATGNSYLGAPPPVGDGLGLGNFMNASEASAMNAVEPGAASAPAPGGNAWDRPEPDPGPPQPHPSQFLTAPGGSVDDFGVGHGALSPRLGLGPGGQGGKFSTFPVKGRQGTMGGSGLRDGPLSLGDDTHEEDSSFANSVAEALSPRSEGRPTEGRPSMDGPPTYSTPSAPPPGAAPALSNPWTEGGPHQSHRDGDESGEEGLAYMSDGNGSRMSRHVRFGEEQAIGHGVGPVDTPTSSMFNPSSHEGTPTSTAFSPHYGPGEVRNSMGSPPMPVPQPNVQAPSSASYRVPPPRVDEPPSHSAAESDEHAANAAAAREVSREMDSINFQPPPRSESPPAIDETPAPAYDAPHATPASPVAASSSPPASPLSIQRERSPVAQRERQGSTARIGSPPGSHPGSPRNQPLPAPTINLPGRTSPISAHTSQVGTPGSYRTASEFSYPRSSSYSRSATSLNSPGTPTGTGGKISAAAFKRPSPRPTDSGLGAGLADTSPLHFKKRTLPSSPHPPQRTGSREPSGVSNSSSTEPLHPGASHGRTDSSRISSNPAIPPPPPPGAGAVRTPPAAEDEDFDYISAYVNGGTGEDGSPRAADYGSLGQVKVANAGDNSPGYQRGRFSTNLEEGGLR